MFGFILPTPIMHLQNMHLRPAFVKKKPPHVRHRCQKRGKKKKKTPRKNGCVASATRDSRSSPPLEPPKHEKPGSEDGFPHQPIDTRSQVLSISHRFTNPRYSALFLFFSSPPLLLLWTEYAPPPFLRRPLLFFNLSSYGFYGVAA